MVRKWVTFLKIEHTWFACTEDVVDPAKSRGRLDRTGADGCCSSGIRVVKSRDPEGALGAPLCHRKIMPLYSGETAFPTPFYKDQPPIFEPHTKMSSRGSQRKRVYFFEGARVQVQIMPGDLMQRLKIPCSITKDLNKKNNLGGK